MYLLRFQTRGVEQEQEIELEKSSLFWQKKNNNKKLIRLHKLNRNSLLCSFCLVLIFLIITKKKKKIKVHIQIIAQKVSKYFVSIYSYQFLS